MLSDKPRRLFFRRPKDVEIKEDGPLNTVSVSIHDAKGKYHYFILDAEATVFIANRDRTER